jgi:hypothetical protein
MILMFDETPAAGRRFYLGRAKFRLHTDAWCSVSRSGHMPQLFG